MNQSLAMTASAQRQEQWRERIGQQAQSGQSVAAFCKEQGLAPQTFYWWRKRLTERDHPVAECAPTSSAFIDLGALGEGGAVAPGIDIRLDLGLGIILTIARR